MSQRKKTNKTLNGVSQEEINHLKELNQRQLNAALSGLTPEQAQRVIDAENNMLNTTGDVRIGSGYKHISDLPSDKGTVIHNPVTEENEAILDPNGNLLTVTGDIHPATKKWQQRIHGKQT